MVGPSTRGFSVQKEFHELNIDIRRTFIHIKKNVCNTLVVSLLVYKYIQLFIIPTFVSFFKQRNNLIFNFEH